LSLLPFKALASSFNPAAHADKGSINLSSNENPYGPSPAARRAMMDMVAVSNRYQWDMITKLIAAIASKNGIAYHNIMIGAGSTEILDNCVQFAARQKGDLILAAPTFSRWTGAAEQQGLQKTEVPLNAAKRHDLAAMLRAITPQTRMVYVCNPNNPTGTICDRNELVSFIAEATKKTLVVVDEAYLEYARETSVSDIAVKNKNLIVVRTFSKIYGLAGGRVGYATGHAETIGQLGKLRSGANIGVSTVSLAGAIASLGDGSFVNSSLSMNEQARAFTIRELERLHIPCIPSHTNFVYFSLANNSRDFVVQENHKKDFFTKLKERNILGTMIFEEDGQWSRITVGTMGEMEQFIEAVK
jgi:histidinol-phosphate aminotransferase